MSFLSPPAQVTWWTRMCYFYVAGPGPYIYGAQGDIFYMTIPTHTVTPPACLSQKVNDARPSLNNKEIIRKTY